MVDHFTLINTETEGEAELREEIQKLRGRCYSLECTVLGLVELLHEHGIDAPDWDPDAVEGRRGPQRYGDLVLDIDRRTVSVAGVDVYLSRKLFDLLAFLATEPNRVFTRIEIYKAVWGFDYGGLATVTEHVCRLRQLIGHDRIVTMHGFGYRFEAQPAGDRSKEPS